MTIDRNKLDFVTIQWLWFLCLLLAALNSSNRWIHYAEATQSQQQSSLQLQQEVKINGPQQQQHQDVTVRNFSPRMDYNNNEWRPVGRGDPLKNDPTFDYSPPTLDRVRYWADSEKDKEKPDDGSAALIDAKLKKANPGKNEILLLGVTGDRIRGGESPLHHPPKLITNAKGETPLLQPKYTSVRRSYYAHQLPTHLMPPPMQPMVPATQQHQLQSSQAHQQQMQAMHMIKPVHTEYKHNTPGHAYVTSAPMSAHSMPHYMSTATQPWMQTSSSPSMAISSLSSGHPVVMMSGNSHRYSQPQLLDAHHQESIKYLSYHNRPSLTSTPSIMLGVNGGIGHHEIYSPNSIRTSSNEHKLSATSSRKPWIHDLLQKEVIKQVKPIQDKNTYNVETIKSAHMQPQHFELIAQQQGISTTYAPVTFVTPTLPSTTSTTQSIYITSTTQKQTSSISQSPMYSSTPPMHTTHAPRTTTTLSPTRLLIPNTSNLAHRPTVSPLQMTTDALFSHYNQPEKPLTGPMYLIIEGHSKVKTYGKDELDPHKPKIVPIIPKREPIVRIADPNEKRGTPETFQVKHLHTKPIENNKIPIKTTTTKPSTSTSATTIKRSDETVSKNITTVKPKVPVKPFTTIKTTPKKLVTTTATLSTTTVKPTTAKSTLKLNITTTSKHSKFEKITEKDIKSSTKNDKSNTSDMKMPPNIVSPNALDTSEKPNRQALENEPPTGMQGLLSFLDSSLDSIFREDPIAGDDSKAERNIDYSDITTKLKPISMQPANSQQQQPIEARVSTKLMPIKAEDYEDYENGNFFKVTTEYLPRETRQIFDYDQLPESRIDLKDETNFGAFLEHIDDLDDLSALSLGDEYEDDEVEEDANSQTTLNSFSSNEIIKHVDNLTSSGTEDEDDDSSVDDNLSDIEENDFIDLARKQQQQNEAKKA